MPTRLIVKAPGLTDGVKMPEVIKPSGTYLLGDTNRNSNSYSTSVCGLSSAVSEVKISNAVEIFPWHNNAATILFIDGHASAQTRWTPGYYDWGSNKEWCFVE